MECVGIAYFSGTGNTWCIAEQYRKALSDHGHSASLLRIEDLMQEQHLYAMGLSSISNLTQFSGRKVTDPEGCG